LQLYHNHSEGHIFSVHQQAAFTGRSGVETGTEKILGLLMSTLGCKMVLRSSFCRPLRP